MPAIEVQIWRWRGQVVALASAIARRSRDQKVIERLRPGRMRRAAH
jgi:hypothetical protein